LPLLEQIYTLNKAAAAEMRGLLWELRPEALEKTTLEELFTQLANTINGRKGIQVSLDLQIAQSESVPVSTRIALYRIAQEALGNTIKHSGASHVSLSVFSSPEKIELCISDNGNGFDVKQTTSGMGLDNMQERAKRIAASFTLTSSEGNGTRILIRWLRNSGSTDEV
jgi:signal transduction histidine kinase